MTEAEKAIILLIKKEKNSISKISKEINRSRGVVSKFLKDPIKYGKIKSPGRPRALSLRARARVVRLAKGKNITANRIKAQLNLKVNKSTVLRAI